MTREVCRNRVARALPSAGSGQARVRKASTKQPVGEEIGKGTASAVPPRANKDSASRSLAFLTQGSKKEPDCRHAALCPYRGKCQIRYRNSKRH